MNSSPPSSPRVLTDVTCPDCGCACDDFTVHVENNRVVRTEHGCELGRAWFETPRPDAAPVCTLAGQEVPLETGIAEAARLLGRARNPLVYGLAEVAIDAQRLAVRLADRLGGTLDTATSAGHASSIIALQRVGQVTCTLGEIRNRSRMIIFWGADVVRTHPCFFTKHSAEATGSFVPGGRADRTCIAIDIAPSATSAKCDHFLQIKPEADLEAIWTLRALAKGVPLDAEQILEQTGVPLARWHELMERMKVAQYGAFCFGPGLTQTRGMHANCDALFSLTREMNEHTRYVACSLGSPGNLSGADNVVTWQTGFPFGVNFNRGYPRYNPGEYTASELLARGEADVALVVGSDPLAELPADAAAQLRSIPLIVISSRPTATTSAATIHFQAATYGLHSPGTIYRMDDVPLPLRPPLTSPLPTESEILTQLQKLLAAESPAP